MRNVARDLLQGALDLHIHAAPDVVPRLMDDLQLAESAREARMAGLVLKSHHVMTADRAQIARRLIPDVEVHGGLALNVPASGGLNPDAVRVAIRLGASIIWLPTISARNHLDGIKRKVTGTMAMSLEGFSNEPVAVVQQDGSLAPGLGEILTLIAEAGIVLGTGHLSVSEQKIVVDAALAAGVTKVLVNHPELWMTSMSIEDQLAMVAKGVFMERCIRSVTAPGNEGLSPKLIADQIKAVGAGSSIMATDYGQVGEPEPARGMLIYIEQMLEYGISGEEIELMVKVNPARLLGK